MKDLIDNQKHIGIIQRFVEVSKRKGRIMTLDRVVYSVANHLFPQYKKDPELVSKIQSIITIQ